MMEARVSRQPAHKPAAAGLTPAELTARLNPTPRYRLLVVLAFPLLFILGAPFWWYTTSIERLPLPTARIAALEASVPVDTRTQILFTADGNAFPKPPPGRGTFSKEQVLVKIASEVTKSADGILGQQRPLERGKRLWDIVTKAPKGIPPPLRIHIRHSDRSNTSFPLQPYIQAPESGLMTSGLPAGTLVIPVHPSQLADRWLNKHYQIAMVKSLNVLFPSLVEPPPIPLRALKYSPNVTLSFVLLNEDASSGGYVRSWDIEAAIEEHLIPHLKPIKEIFNVTIESQILYHAPLSFEPTYGSLPKSQVDPVPPLLDAAKEGNEEAGEIAKELIDEHKDEAWLVSEDETKIFVNSEKWSLDSGSTNNPVLRFLLFIPSASHRPMRLGIPDTANAFLLPQYGAVALLDPPASAASAASYHLPCSALKGTFHIFTQHLYSLLALPTNDPYIGPSPSSSPLMPPNPLTPPISPWQIQQVMRMRAKENSEEARKTLAGIVRVVKKIKEMKVGQKVRGKVLGAVERLEKMNQTTDTLEAFKLSRDAVALANEAFFDPSMMGLLYFPDEHKFAVYTPLFAPVAIPMIVGLIKEFLNWRKRRRDKGKPAVVAQDRSVSEAKLDASQDEPESLQQTRAEEVDGSSVNGMRKGTDEGGRSTRTLRSRSSTAKA